MSLKPPSQKSAEPQIIDQNGKPIGGKSTKSREPIADWGAIPEAIGKFVLFLRSPSGLVCVLFGLLIVVAFKNIEQYPAVVRMLGWSQDPTFADCALYWALIQCFQLVGGISFASKTLQAAGFLAERGRAYPEASTNPNASKLALKRRKRLEAERDTQMYVLWAISFAAYIFDIATVSHSMGQLFDAVGTPNFLLLGRVAWITMLFDAICILIVILREHIPGRAARDFLGALSRGEVIKMPTQVGDWQRPDSRK
ncbi:MAG: hypothetical protein KME18_18140 [Phormidium tanganyikae FI6-MK23]|jgi:hypothetical protein|nr:hypothetical protein [Phormidium tanganyikae FI6-MK23]